MKTEDLTAHEISVQEKQQLPTTLHLTFWQNMGINLLLLLATLLWGSTFLVMKDSIKVTGPFTFLALRFSIGAAVLVILFYRRLKRISWVELRSGLIIGLFLFVAYSLQTLGLQYTTTSMAAFITSLYVPFVPLFAILFLHQWPSKGVIPSILLSFLGLMLIAFHNNFTFSFGLGELLTLGCAIAYALHIVSISKFAPGADAINLSIIQIALTALLSWIAAPIAREPLVMPPLAIWGSALFLGVFATAFCLVVMNRVQQFISSVRATLGYALEPVWTAVFGYFVGERLGPVAWAGCICILLAMVVGNIRLNIRFRVPKRRR
ncbi:MAG TPA: DMT family transporter [Ktedonobacteraceae bacterium]|jgi:drug/metabolite transporter (DMT)-like permease